MSIRPMFPSASRALPSEIVDLIVRDECLTTPDIHNLSLVSYIWKGPSQRRLFTSITLDPGKEHPLFSLPPNSDSWRLVQSIKHLTLIMTSVNSWIPFPCDDDEDMKIQWSSSDSDPELKVAKEDYFSNLTFIGTKLGATSFQLVPEPEARGPLHPEFPSFLRQLSKLESLRVRNRMNWHLLPADAVQAFLYIFGLDSFRSLDIWRGAGARLPFIFLYFCFNIERLFLNAWPTTDLNPIGIQDSDLSRLEGKPNIRPTALKLVSARIVGLVQHYLTKEQWHLGLGNSISFDRLRALYIAYDEDPISATTGGQWPSKQVGSFLSSFGQPIEELTLEVDHRNSTSRAASPIPASDLSNLTSLLHLHLNIYTGCLPELDFEEAFSWLLPFLNNLPKPAGLQTLQITYLSSFQWTEEFDNRVHLGENFLEELFELLVSSFTGLKAVKIQIRLLCTIGLGQVSPACSLVCRRDYEGLVKLQEKGVSIRFDVALRTRNDSESDL